MGTRATKHGGGTQSFEQWCDGWIDGVRRTALSLLRRDGTAVPVALLAGVRQSGGRHKTWTDTLALLGERLAQDVEYVRREARSRNALAVCMVFMGDEPRAGGQGVDSRLQVVVERGQDAWSWSWPLRRRGKRWVVAGRRRRDEGHLLGGLRLVDAGFVRRFVRKRLEFALGERVWRVVNDAVADVWNGSGVLEPPGVDDLVAALDRLPERGVVLGAARTRRVAELVIAAIAAQGFRVAV